MSIFIDDILQMILCITLATGGFTATSPRIHHVYAIQSYLSASNCA